MHGILFKSLKDFVVTNHDHQTWDEVRRAADLDGQVYLPIDTYDDAELGSLVEATADLTGEPMPDLLTAFGRHVAAQLLDTYGNVVDDDWTTLDVVANAETRIHAVLRSHDSDLDPPELACRRDGDQVTVAYRSPRRLCFVAEGIVRGVADHYGEQVTVLERTCMREGAERCELVVRG